MANYYYYLGPWIWVVEDEVDPGSWNAPEGTVGLLDLRPIPDQSLAGTYGDKPYSFFATTKELDSSYTLLGKGDCRDIHTDNRMKNIWKSLIGYRPDGDKLVDLLWDQLTNGSDVDGIIQCCPLNPEFNNLALHLGGHSIVKKERFVWGKHQHTAKLLKQKQKQFEKYFNAAKNGKLKDSEHYRRILDAWCEECKTDDWQQFVPQKLKKDVPGRLKHETVITDDFNRADEPLDGSFSAEGWSWAWFHGTNFSEIVSNSVRKISASNTDFGHYVAQSDLSSSNHYAQYQHLGNNSNRQIGVLTRIDVSGPDFYGVNNDIDGNPLTLFKLVGGTQTTIISGNFGMGGFNAIHRLEVVGSNLKTYRNAILIHNVTDTSISSGLRCGYRQMSNATASSVMFDNFEAGDLDIPSETEVIQSLQLNTESLSTLIISPQTATESLNNIIASKQTVDEWLKVLSRNNTIDSSWLESLVISDILNTVYLNTLNISDEISLSWLQTLFKSNTVLPTWLAALNLANTLNVESLTNTEQQCNTSFSNLLSITKTNTLPYNFIHNRIKSVDIAVSTLKTVDEVIQQTVFDYGQSVIGSHRPATENLQAIFLNSAATLSYLGHIFPSSQLSTAWERVVSLQRQACSEWLISNHVSTEVSIDWLQILTDMEIIPVDWHRDSIPDIDISSEYIWITDITGRVWSTDGLLRAWITENTNRTFEAEE